MMKMKKRYKKYFEERSINQLHQVVDTLYNQYKGKFTTLSDLVDFISKKLGTNKNNVLQILSLIEKNNV